LVLSKQVQANVDAALAKENATDSQANRFD